MASIPGLSDSLAKIVQQYISTGKVDYDISGSKHRQHSLWSRRSIANGDKDAEFFGSGQAGTVYSNLAKNQLDANNCFVAKTMRFVLEPGVSLTGAADANTIVAVAGGAANLIPANAAADADRLRRSGILREFKLGDRVFLKDIWDLHNFPAGMGTDGVASFATTVAAPAERALAMTQSGTPLLGNVFKFETPIPLIPGQTISALVQWPGTLTIGNPLTVRLQFDGFLFAE
jgi:hypothetical protein